MKRASLLFVFLTTLGIVGTVTYLARSRPEEFSSQPQDAVTSSQPIRDSSRSAIVSCVGSTEEGPGHSIAVLDVQHRSALSLVSKKQSAAALQELRNVAAIDPGYPGINLDIADALLKSKRATEAKDAIELQLGISGCLSKLPESELQAYCSSQGSLLSPEGCHTKLSGILDRAVQEASLVRAKQDLPPAALVDASTATPRSTVPPHTSDATPSTPTAASKPEAIPFPVPVVENRVASKPLHEDSLATIKTAEASAHIGERERVCGEVVGKKFVAETNGKPTFINLDRPFPQPSFTVVVWGNDLPQTGELPDSGELCVTGTIVSYRGTPEIIVHDAKAWSRGAQQ